MFDQSRKFASAAARVLMTTIIAHAQQQRSPEEILREMNSLGWQTYPAIGMIGNQAQIRLSNEIRFLDAANTNRFIQLNGNPPVSNAYTIAPRKMEWFSVFEFDPDELLTTLKEQNVHGIEERKRLGLPVLHLTGWFVAPHYDVETKRLEW